MAKRQDHLEQWTVWLRDMLSARGKKAHVGYDDKLGGDVLVLALDASEQDKLVEVTVARRPKGRAHLTVMATTQSGVTSAREAFGRMHNEISRLANAKRKFVHRIERMLDELARTWTERAAHGAAEREAALAWLLDQIAQAEPMTGVGFHTDVAGAEDHHTKEVYPSVHGAAIQLDGRWRGLAWDPEKKRWVIRPGTLTALRKAYPQADLEKSGITLLDAALVGAGVVAAAAVAADINEEIQRTQKKDSGWDCGDVLDPCDILDCSLSGADLGNCVPDCDLGGLDCGGLDCSL